MALSENKIKHRAKTMLTYLDGTDKENRDILERAGLRFSTETETEQVKTDSNNITIDDVKNAIKTGLAENNPQIVRVAMDYLAEQEGRDYMSSLDVEVVPYRIADTSITRIIQECDEDLLEQIEEALAERRRGAVTSE